MYRSVRNIALTLLAVTLLPGLAVADDRPNIIFAFADDWGREASAYREPDRPTISDREFDLLLEELIRLEQANQDLFDPNSPSQRVGGQITKNFPTVVHKRPMLSLSNTYSREEVEDFIRRVKSGLEKEEVHFVCELKYDGVAIGIGGVHEAPQRTRRLSFECLPPPRSYTTA